MAEGVEWTVSEVGRRKKRAKHGEERGEKWWQVLIYPATPQTMM